MSVINNPDAEHRGIKPSAESRMKLKSDIATISEVQFKSGLERGLVEGSRQTKLETAKLMKEENLSLDLITKITGLSQEEVAAIS